MTYQQFQEAFQKLQHSLPRHPNYIDECENSDYGNYLFQCKNVYFGFETARCTDGIYLFDTFKSVNCCDGDYVIESQNCYDCVDTVRCNNCTYLNYCSRMYDSHFCWDCSDSNDLFGCVALQYKEYCIFNKQYSQEEYLQKIEELKKRPIEENFVEMKKVAERLPVTQSHVYNSENADYCNQVFYSKNMYLCFDSTYSENCAYLYDSHDHNKNDYDMTQSHRCESCYECTDCSDLQMCHHMNYCGWSYESAFCNDCEHSHHLFGCIGLKHKEYCILNKQYTKDDYEKEVKEIMESYREYFK